MTTRPSTLVFLGKNVLGSIVAFPFWWYSKGIVLHGRAAWGRIMHASRTLALRIQLTHLFTPMYGDRSVSGRLISFFARAVQLLVTCILFMVLTVLSIVRLVVYTFLPVGAVTFFLLSLA